MTPIFDRQEVFYEPPRKTKWAIQKIATDHLAHQNNPAEYPVGGWYCCQIDDWHQYLRTEFYAPTWSEAIERTTDVR